MTSVASPPLVQTDAERGLFQVSRRSFTDRSLLDLEFERVFDRCWLYLGHESELPKPGSFLTRTVARRNVLFTRDAGGTMHALLNTCPHRGAQVCRERSGTSRNFQCFYHGWVFGSDGALKNRPGDESYSPCHRGGPSDRMTAVPRLDSYAGFCFISFDPDIVPLPEYLAGAKDYLDIVASHSASGMAIVDGAQEYSIRANWKLLVENSFDGYHAATTHSTYLDYLKNTNGSLNKVALEGRGYDLGNGHGAVEYKAPWGRPIAQWIPLFGDEGKAEMDTLYADLTKRHGEARASRIAHSNRNMVIFPNLVINDIMSLTVRTFYPTAPDQMMVTSWAMGPQQETEWARKYRLYNFLEFLGPGGFATPDDVEALESCQTGFANAALAGWSDISKGMGRAEPSYDDELQMRAFWTRWHELITTGAAAGGQGGKA